MFITRTQYKYDSLPEATQKECLSTYELMKKYDDFDPVETWKSIVNYYYDEENRIPADWFNYFDY